MSFREKIRSYSLLHRCYGFYTYLKFRYELYTAKRHHQKSVRIDDDLEIVLPDPLLRYRVHRAFDIESFVNVGQKNSNDLVAILKAIDPPKKRDFVNILDFACGCGRVLQHFYHRVPMANFYASDIDEEAIAWCENNLNGIAEFSCNQISPPTRYNENHFDLIYVVSLFTHLDEESQFNWLEELKRILKPDGVLIASVHGENSQPWHRPKELNQLINSGFYYRVDHTGFLKLDGLPNSYQTTFHTKSYILSEWSSILTIDKYIERGINDHQDVVVMSKTW